MDLLIDLKRNAIAPMTELWSHYSSRAHLVLHAFMRLLMPPKIRWWKSSHNCTAVPDKDKNSLAAGRIQQVQTRYCCVSKKRSFYEISPCDEAVRKRHSLSHVGRFSDTRVMALITWVDQVLALVQSRGISQATVFIVFNFMA